MQDSFLRKTVLGIVGVATLLLPLIAQAEDLPYEDSTYLNHFEAVYQVSEWEWLGGYSDGTFRGYNEMNRAELAKVLALSTGKTEEELTQVVNDYVAANGASAAGFTDVDATLSTDQLWYVDYVIYGKSQGWFTGYPDGSFRPGDPANIAETIKMMIESQWGTPGQVYSGAYWYDRYLTLLKFFDIIYSTDGKLYYNVIKEPVGFDQVPTSKVTRSDVAELIYRIHAVLDEGNGSFVEYDPYLTLAEYQEVYDADIDVREKTDGLEISIADSHFGFKANEIEIEGANEGDIRIYVKNPSAFNNGYETTWELVNKADTGMKGTVLKIKIIDADYERPKISDVDCYMYAGIESEEEAEATCHGDAAVLSGDFEFAAYLNPADYKEFIDDGYTYRIEYPDEWETHFDSGFQIASPTDGSEDVMATIALVARDVSGYENLTLESYAEVLKLELNASELDYNPVETGTRNFGIYEGMYLLGQYSVFGFNVDILTVYTIVDNSAYILTYVYETGEKTAYDHIANHVIESFQLLYQTESSPTIDYYRVYEDETYSLAVSYPESWTLTYRPEGALAGFTSPLEDESDSFRESATLTVKSVEDIEAENQALDVYIETVQSDIVDDLPEDAYLPLPPEKGYYYDVLGTGSTHMGDYYAYFTNLQYFTDEEDGTTEWRVFAYVTIQSGNAYILSYTYDAEKEDRYADYFKHMVESFELDVAVYLTVSDYANSVMNVVDIVYARIEDTVEAYNKAVPNIVTAESEIETGEMSKDYEDALSSYESADQILELKSENKEQQSTFEEEFEKYLEIAGNYLNNYEQMLNYYIERDYEENLSMATDHDNDLTNLFISLYEQKTEIEDEMNAFL